ELVSEASEQKLAISRPYRKLVAIRSPQNLFMLEKAPNETDPRTTDLIVMTAKIEAPAGIGDATTSDIELRGYDQQLMTAVVQRAETAGKVVKPLIVPTNNALHAVLAVAQKLGVQEIILGASNKFSAEDQLDQIALYWLELHGGEPAPLSVRILSRGRDVRLDLGGGHPIPVAELGPARSTGGPGPIRPGHRDPGHYGWRAQLGLGTHGARALRRGSARGGDAHDGMRGPPSCPRRRASRRCVRCQLLDSRLRGNDGLHPKGQD